MTHDPSMKPVGPQSGPTSTHQPERRGEGTGGAAFRALLDELHEKTRRVREDGASLSEPVELAGAVDRAGASIDDALSLSDRLLEAYQAARQRADGTTDNPETTDDLPDA